MDGTTSPTYDSTHHLTTMATFSTVVSFAVLFIASSVSIVGGEGSNKNVEKTCIGTPFPETCVSTLSWFNESKDADARSMAGLMVWATMPSLADSSSTAGVQYINHEDLSDEDSRCFNGCRDEMENAYKKLDAAYGDAGKNIGAVKLTDVRKFLEQAKKKHTVWNCDRCRHGEMKNKVDEISRGNEAEKRMAVLSVLVDRATK